MIEFKAMANTQPTSNPMKKRKDNVFMFSILSGMDKQSSMG
jgi:hypothetical protein